MKAKSRRKIHLEPTRVSRVEEAESFTAGQPVKIKIPKVGDKLPVPTLPSNTKAYPSFSGIDSIAVRCTFAPGFNPDDITDLKSLKIALGGDGIAPIGAGDDGCIVGATLQAIQWEKDFPGVSGPDAKVWGHFLCSVFDRSTIGYWIPKDNTKFDMFLLGGNEYGFAAWMAFKGIKITTISSGLSIEDLTNEEEFGFVADDIILWQPFEPPNWKEERDKWNAIHKNANTEAIENAKK